MRYPILAFLTLVLLWPAHAPAQPSQKVRINDVQIGFPGAAEPGQVGDDRHRVTLFKAGHWVPVYVDVEAAADGTEQPGQVLVETTDSDDVQNRFHATPGLPKLEGREQVTVLNYTRPGSLNADITITVQVDGQTVESKKNANALAVGDMLYLAVGSRLPSLRQVLAARWQKANQASLPARERAAYVDGVERLPHRWFGYDAVDVMVLTGGNRDFLIKLLEDQYNRKEALNEWVRRGGHLILSTGRHQDVMAKLLDACFPALPVAIKGKMQQQRLTDVESYAGTQLEPLVNVRNRQGVAPPLEVARLQRRPGRSLDILAPDQDRQEPGHPLLIVRCPYGMGQITLVAFDLDGPAFTQWKGQKDFWERLLHLTDLPPNANAGAKVPLGGALDNTENSSELADGLQTNLEQFEDIPVISFGWVALFICIYILIVGPLDYFFLKKVVKRLELTWITFPAVVLSVSAIAYLAAYALKGHDLKVNKVDVVDVDLASGLVYGTTWFTIFSPRIEHYTIGIEPAAPAWAAEASADKGGDSTVVTWLGRPDSSYGGYGRARSQGLFRRTYDYEPKAAGLTGVPIQVWATKSFTASWDRALNPGQPPLLAELQHPHPRGNADADEIVGTVTSRLPVALEDVALLYSIDKKGVVYPLGRLEPNQPKTIRLQRGDKAVDLPEWAPGSNMTEVSPYNARSSRSFGPTTMIIKRALFFEASSQREQATNDALRLLDQSWRLHQDDQAILFARVPRIRIEGGNAPANAEAGLPSRLWLGQLPGSAKRPPKLSGTLVQDTYVRFFIPLKQAAP